MRESQGVYLLRIPVNRFEACKHGNQQVGLQRSGQMVDRLGNDIQRVEGASRQGSGTSPIQNSILPPGAGTSYLRTNSSVPSSRMRNTARFGGCVTVLSPSRDTSGS